MSLFRHYRKKHLVGSMNMHIVTKDNVKEMAKLSGRNEQRLRQELEQAAANKEQLWVQIPLPKHLR